MFAPQFDYYRASSVAEAAALLAEHPEAKLLAGGHSLIPLLKLRLAAPSALVDIGRIDSLRSILEESGTIDIGALTKHAELASLGVAAFPRDGLGRSGRDDRRSCGAKPRNDWRQRRPRRPGIRPPGGAGMPWRGVSCHGGRR